jgi:hypothetical protein
MGMKPQLIMSVNGENTMKKLLNSLSIFLLQDQREKENPR